MKNTILALIVVVILLAVASVFLADSATGFFVLEGGTVQSVGEQTLDNPKYAVVYGSIVWEIKDGDTVISTDIPDEEVDIYFVPTGSTVDWNEDVECEDEIKGKIKNLDADGDGEQCTTTTYPKPTAYECGAKSTDGDDITIYKTIANTTEWNEGCFAAKIRPGEYDIYA